MDLDLFGREQLRISMTISVGTIFVFVMSAFASVQKDDSSYLRLGFGYFDILNNNNTHQTPTGHVEFISGNKIFNLKAFLGVMGTNKGTKYAYTGLRYDWYVTTTSLSHLLYRRHL